MMPELQMSEMAEVFRRRMTELGYHPSDRDDSSPYIYPSGCGFCQACEACETVAEELEEAFLSSNLDEAPPDVGNQCRPIVGWNGHWIKGPDPEKSLL